MVGSAVIVLATGWSAGVALGALVPHVPVLVLLGAAGICLLAGFVAPAGLARLLALALTAVLLGLIRVDTLGPGSSPDPLASFTGEVVLTGRILDAPLARGSRFETVLDVEAVTVPGAATTPTPLADPRPRVLLRAAFMRAAYGDRIETRGRLGRPRSRPGWPVEEMLARRGIHWTFDAGGVRVVERAGPSLVGLLDRLRATFEANTRALLPEPHASLVAGIVFGARVGLPPELRSAMSATGTSHLTAVSGANVALVAGAILLGAATFTGRVSASVIAIVGVWLYTLLVGVPPSALRAATMATFALTARAFGRQPDAIAGLALAVAALLAWDPGLAWDLGFQLSATATAGLILLAPPIEQLLMALPRPIRGQIAIGIAAQVATLPLIVGTFQRLSLVSLPANLLAFPTIVPIMGLGVLIALFGRVPYLGDVLGWWAWLVTSALLLVIETAAMLPGAVVAVGRAPDWLPVLWYGALVCWVAARSPDLRGLGVRAGHLQVSALAGLMLTIGLFAGDLFGFGARDGVEVVLLDTEPASAFVRTTSGTTALIATSASARGLVAATGQYLELWERQLDLEVGPAGLRTSVGLLDVGRSLSSTDGMADPTTEAGDEGTLVDEANRQTASAPGPGARVVLDERVAIEVIDARLAGQTPVLDLLIRVDDVMILLPGPGTPSQRWTEIPPDAITVAVMPSSAVSWARLQPARNWLVLVGEPSAERARGASEVPFLVRRDHGAVELSVARGTVRVRTERCANGRRCEAELPAPSIRSLLPGEADDDRHASP